MPFLANGINLHPFMTVLSESILRFQRASVVLIDNGTVMIVEQDARVCDFQFHKRAANKVLPRAVKHKSTWKTA
jgi:hypothetical protein